MISFEKVSFEQFAKDWGKYMQNSHVAPLESIYKHITLPKRATQGSAGYDFFSPCQMTIAPGARLSLPTGIRVKMPENVVLMLFPRSGLGIRYHMQLANTVGIIDSDYYSADNEGHIIATFLNGSEEEKTLYLDAQQGFMQGIFMPFLLTSDDDAEGPRTGGFGSTDKKLDK